MGGSIISAEIFGPPFKCMQAMSIIIFVVKYFRGGQTFSFRGVQIFRYIWTGGNGNRGSNFS